MCVNNRIIWVKARDEAYSRSNHGVTRKKELGAHDPAYTLPAVSFHSDVTLQSPYHSADHLTWTAWSL